MLLSWTKKKYIARFECQVQKYDKYVVKVSSDPLIKPKINHTKFSLFFQATYGRRTFCDFWNTWSNNAQMESKGKLGELCLVFRAM